ncbi:transglycosylase SLT domain-containing protein [Rubrobacter marinus]|uniref:Transglycosylase SLT domain-containing protein n=2 Tax=Rubrobacter marinus TaxID=2653852 RepID=A0A6G8PVK9_9ACTN|nr:transglycosylase SLT domain-containing protein [Rubrobacter marinus]
MGMVGARAKKGKRYYGRSRERRRRLAPWLILLAILLLAVPVVLRVPDVVQRALHPLRYEDQIRAAAAENGLEPAFVAGVIYVESRYDPDVRSSQGAYGLMQVLPQTATFISERSGITGDYRDPGTNVRMGAWYLSYLLGRYDGNEALALAAYNSGEGQVDSWLAEGRSLPEGIPFEETRDYVTNAAEARDTYAEIYGSNLDRDAR